MSLLERLWWGGRELRADDAGDDETLYGSGSGLAIPVRAGWAGAAVATGRSAAVETASGMLGRALQAARISGPEWAVSLLTPRIRSVIARGMVTEGETVLLLEVSRAGRALLLPARASVFGSPDPDTWIYWATPRGPSTPGPWRRYGRDQVAHFRYEVDPAAPWRGVTPADGLDARLNALVTAALAREASGPHGNVLVVRPTRGTSSGDTKWAPGKIEEAKRRLPAALGELSRGGLAILTLGDSQASAGQGESRQGTVARVGFAPPAAVAALQQQSFDAVIASYGIPPNVVTETGYSRDALRQYTDTVARPLVDSIVAEVARVLEVELQVGPIATRTAADWVSLGRAANSLRQAGYDQARIEEMLAL